MQLEVGYVKSAGVSVLARIILLGRTVISVLRGTTASLIASLVNAKILGQYLRFATPLMVNANVTINSVVEHALSVKMASTSSLIAFTAAVTC